MPSTSSGRISKSRRAQKLTPHQKNHRWESFTTKISKLHSLDPLRKVRRHDLDAEDLSTTTSYLKTGLERWGDTNLSQSFTFFKRELLPVCDSLPQILHFQDKIMDSLAGYISRQEKGSLEPLLDLLTAFAHDLGVRFEKHYPQALELIVSVASQPQDADVIEWTFASLAFLFKYLSRLLVPDLRPTYNTLAPLLGKSRKPGHIARFAGEAMSFLIKKAAAPANREKALPLIVEHARDDLLGTVGTKQFGLYSDGLMTMFAEAIKGPGNTIHSSGPEVLRALIRSIPAEEFVPAQSTTWRDLCSGVLVSLIHHSTADTFNEMVEAIVAEAAAELDATQLANRPWRIGFFISLVGILSGVRKGSRISHWPSLVQTLSRLLQAITESSEGAFQEQSSLVWGDIITHIAIVWHQAPVDTLISNLAPLTDAMTRRHLMSWFIPFCAYLAKLNPERFRSLLQKEFQGFIVSHWVDVSNEDMLCVFIPRMVEYRGLPAGNEKEACNLPQSWQDQIVAKFEQLEVTPFPERGAYDKDPTIWRDKCLPKYTSLLHVMESTSSHPSTNARIGELLLKKVKLALRPSTLPTTEETLFIVGEGFKAYLRMSESGNSLDATLSPLLRAALPRFCRHIQFLESFLAYEQGLSKQGRSDNQSSIGSDTSQPEENPLLKSLVANLSAPSHQLRLVSLQILKSIEDIPEQYSVLEIMRQVEQLPLDLQNARNFGMYLRKLSLSYASLPAGSWLLDGVPHFLFGMLTVPMSPLWDDAVEALKQVSEVKVGEEAVSNIAFDWLERPSLRWSGPQKAPVHANKRIPLTDFECLNLRRLQEESREIETAADNASEEMLSRHQQTQRLVDTQPEVARTRALKVFSAIPTMAEKRSRKLVPYLLSWTTEQESPEEVDSEDKEVAPAGGWSLGDKKALIGVFSQFGNPKALFQSEKVYDALLKLLGNGDVEIQKLALKAILAWKQDGVKPFKENLENLLDESKFKNELTTTFLGDSHIQPDHRPELMPVLLRLLYGRAISKKGAASGRQGLHATRLFVIRSLSVEDAGEFLRIGLGRLQNIQIVDSSGICETTFSHDIVPVRTQLGVVNMLEAIINELGIGVTPYMEAIVNAVLYCLISTCRKLQSTADVTETSEEVKGVSLLRTTRTTSLKCLCALFRNATHFDWSAYKDVIVSEVVSPFIEKLPLETAQGVSWTWKLLSTWSQLPDVALFLAVDGRIVPKIVESLGIEKGKDEVKIFALSIVRNLMQLVQADASESTYNELIQSELLDCNADRILRAIDGALREQHDMGRGLLEACVDTVVEISPLVEKSANVRSLVDISTFLLSQPSRNVNPKVKGSLLLILERFILLDDLQNDIPLKESIYSTLASLFSFFRDRQNRQTLSRVLKVFASQDASKGEVADLCSDLNAYVEMRLDQPDYDRRLVAFNAISRKRDETFTSEQWLPLLHNLVFYIRRDEEFGVLSSNSADGLCKFIEASSSAASTPSETGFTVFSSNILLPALYAGVRDESETVRREILRVMGFLVSHMGHWLPVEDLVSLVPKDDEESDRAFFFNILSPAVSRQLQALQLLEAANGRSEFSSKNISQFFIPLLEHLIFGRAEGSDDRGLGAQATTTIASLCGSLEWAQYRALLRRFLSFINSKPDSQKQVIRLLDKVIETLTNSAKRATEDIMDLDQPTAVAPNKRRLASTLPDMRKLCDEVTINLLPPLLGFLHGKDESTVSSRVPVGVIIVKLLNVLPPQVRDQKLPGALTDICHILRSQTWESREMARETLTKISCILGPGYFGFVLSELKGALIHGFQLHVLSYTMHSLLLAVIPQFKQGDLDYCLESMVTVIMDDIFGVTGQQKDAEEYVSKMKEVKSSKSQDSMELIAKNASISRLVDLVKPLQALLLEKLDVRMARKIDDILSRITTGLLQNPAAESRDTLMFCYEVIQDVYKSARPKIEPQIDRKLRRYLIQKGAGREGGVTFKFTHKLIRFALDVLRSILRKHDSLRNAGNISGFLPILGDSVVDGEEEVKIAAFRLLAVLVKVPFKNDDSSNLYKVAAKEAIKVIGTSATTASDMAQAALKLLSVVLRDRREVPIKDAATDMLLNKLKDGLTDPQHRHVTFNFLRSVLDRKVETATVYDTLDYVGTVMITNDDTNTRDLARGAFFQFLRDYPQKKNRWSKQLTFIVANLKYEREGGRISVMEVIHLLLLKSADDFVQEITAACFIPLIFVLANDDSEKCRLAAGELIKEIFRKSSKENLKNFLRLLRSWADDEKPAVLKLALQAFGFYFEVSEGSVKDKKDLNTVIDRVTEVLGDPAQDWGLVNTCLQTVQVLLGKFPSRILSSESDELWDNIQECLFRRDGAVKLTAIHLLGIYLTDYAGNLAQEKGLVGSYGLVLEKSDISRLVRGCLSILGAIQVDEALVEETPNILVFLGRHLKANAFESSPEDAEVLGEEEDEEEDTKELDLQFLLRRLAGVVRKERQPNAASLVPKLAALNVLEALCRTTAKETLEPSFKAILRPLRNITDPSIPKPFSLDDIFKARFETLTAKAHTVMEVLQKKFGTADYSRYLLHVGEDVRDARQQRSSKRKIEAITAPEKFGRDKRKKAEKNKERRKARGLEHRNARRGY